MEEFRGRDDTVRVWDLRHGGCRHVLRGHSSWVTAMTFSADERFSVTGSHDQTIRIWDLSDGTCTHTLQGHTADALSLSDDGRYLLSGDEFDGTVRFWDVASERCLRTFPGHKNGTVAVHFDPGGRAGLSIGHDRTVRRWSLPAEHEAPFHVSRPRTPSQLNLLDARIRSLADDAERAMTDGQHPAALDLLTQARAVPGWERHPRVMRAWRALESRCARTQLRGAWLPRILTGHAGDVSEVDVSPDGRIAVSAGIDGTIRVWQLDTGACTRVLDGHAHRVVSVCLHPDGDRLLSSSKDGTIRLWDIGTGECTRVLESRARTGPGQARFAADGRQAIVVDSTGDLQLWDLETGDLVRSMRTSAGHDLSVAADGRLAAYARGDCAQLWDLQRGVRTRSLGREFLQSMHGVCLSANGGLALTSEDKGIWLWDTASGSALRTFSSDDPDRNTVIAMTADGRFAVSAGYGCSAAVWDLATGHLMRELDGLERGMICLAITPDGTRLVSGTSSGALRLWELEWELDASQPPSDSPAAPAWTWGLDEGEVPADDSSDEGRVLIIGFHPEEGRVIVARNSPDLSRYVVIFIPGVGAGPERTKELTERAEILHYLLTGVTRERVSVVIWMDYQAPATARDARDAAPAAEGATRLMEFITQQRVVSQLDDRARITVIGHGYGGLVVGHAARDYSLDVDALVFLGSASAGVARASDLHVTGAVYATSPDLFGDGTPDDVHGPRPDSPSFGAKVLIPTPFRYRDDPMEAYFPWIAEIILALPMTGVRGGGWGPDSAR